MNEGFLVKMVIVCLCGFLPFLFVIGIYVSAIATIQESYDVSITLGIVFGFEIASLPFTTCKFFRRIVSYVIGFVPAIFLQILLN